MNKRIREIAKEHGFVHDFMTVGEYNDALQKFEKIAELIIRECLDIVNRKEYSYHEADPLWETAQLIKDHFGVEE